MKAAAFFSELKRRNVLRAAAFYIAAVWALAQGLAQLLPVFNAPNWVTKWFVMACIIGFPFWVVKLPDSFGLIRIGQICRRRARRQLQKRHPHCVSCWHRA